MKVLSEESIVKGRRYTPDAIAQVGDLLVGTCVDDRPNAFVSSTEIVDGVLYATVTGDGAPGAFLEIPAGCYEAEVNQGGLLVTSVSKARLVRSSN